MTMRRRMGCSPYYAVTGATPLIPLDITEATYLLLPPLSVLSTTDLIAWRAIALQKRPEQLEELQQWVHASHLTAAMCFKKKHFRTIINYVFKWEDLVLMRNTRIEKFLNKKMKPQYLGPLIGFTLWERVRRRLNSCQYHGWPNVTWSINIWKGTSLSISKSKNKTFLTSFLTILEFLFLNLYFSF